MRRIVGARVRRRQFVFGRYVCRPLRKLAGKPRRQGGNRFVRVRESRFWNPCGVDSDTLTLELDPLLQRGKPPRRITFCRSPCFMRASTLRLMVIWIQGGQQSDSGCYLYEQSQPVQFRPGIFRCVQPRRRGLPPMQPYRRDLGKIGLDVPGSREARRGSMPDWQRLPHTWKSCLNALQHPLRPSLDCLSSHIRIRVRC